jgi:TonB family protein
MSRLSSIGEFLRIRGFGLAAGAVLIGLVGLAVKWVAKNHDAPPPRKVMQYTVVNTQPPPPPKAPPPPPPVTPPKEIEPEQATRVELKATDMIPPDAPRPSNEPSGGKLSLAAEGEGPGDAFNLAGKVGGRGILSGGGLGDGTGDDGLGAGNSPGNRFGWYYSRLASEIEEAFRGNKQLQASSARVEVRIWADPTGRISKVRLVRSTGDPRVDEAIQSIVGLKLREAPPSDIPMPMVARLTARRPE